MGANLNDLVTVSRYFGSDPKWVVAGGGNTSFKDDDVLYVKASGFPLATIDEGGFARMDRGKLAVIWDTEYPSGKDAAAVAEREKMVLADMMAARMPGEERRPSVETLLHNLLPWPLVVHLHPTLVNGLTCGVRGPEIAVEIFGDTQEWIPVCNPGYVLAKHIRSALVHRSARGLDSPDYILLANHGVFVGGRDAEEIQGKYRRLHETLKNRLVYRPGTMPVTAPLPGDAEALKRVASGLFGDSAKLEFITGGELDRYLADDEAAAPLTGSLTPDHIVYSGPGALFLGAKNPAEDWSSAAEAYIGKWGKPPNITLLNNGSGIPGALAAAAGRKALGNAVLLLKNTLEVCAFSESFGGPLGMEEPLVRFIVNWEVENYRSRMTSG